MRVRLAILGLKNEEGFQNFKDSGGPFGWWGLHFPGEGFDFEERKAAIGIGKYQFSKNLVSGGQFHLTFYFNFTLIVNFQKFHLQRALLHYLITLWLILC